MDQKIFQGSATSGEAVEALRLFMGAAYPVSTDINPRGYNWCEAYLDQARRAALAAKAEQSNTPVPRVGGNTNIDSPEFRERMRGMGAHISIYGESYQSFVGYVNRFVAASVERAAAPASVPEGYRLVPVEPTPAMIDAYNAAPCGFAGSPAYGGHVWDAMISAAPEVAQPAAQGERAGPKQGEAHWLMLAAGFACDYDKARGVHTYIGFIEDAERLLATPAPTAGEPSAPPASVAYGCHCDLFEDNEPDGCVIDDNRRNDCIYANKVEAKEQCGYWRPISLHIKATQGGKGGAA